MDNERLKEILEPIAENYGFGKSNAVFKPFADFKVKWTRSYKWIEMTVSDYLKNAPEDVIENIFEVVLSRIVGELKGYSDATNEYLISDDFREKNLKTFLKRKRFTEHPEKEAIVKILEGNGIDISDLMVVVSKGYNASTLFRTMSAPIDYDESKILEEADTIIDGLKMFCKDLS